MGGCTELMCKHHAIFLSGTCASLDFNICRASWTQSLTDPEGQLYSEFLHEELHKTYMLCKRSMLWWEIGRDDLQGHCFLKDFVVLGLSFSAY